MDINNLEIFKDIDIESFNYLEEYLKDNSDKYESLLRYLLLDNDHINQANKEEDKLDKSLIDFILCEAIKNIRDDIQKDVSTIRKESVLLFSNSLTFIKDIEDIANMYNRENEDSIECTTDVESYIEAISNNEELLENNKIKLDCYINAFDLLTGLIKYINNREEEEENN